MVVLSNSHDSPNTTASTPSPARNLLLLQKLKQVSAQEQAKLCENQQAQVSAKTSKRLVVHKRLVKNHDSSSSTSPETKLQLIKRSHLQEKLLLLQCKKMNEKNVDTSLSVPPSARKHKSTSQSIKKCENYDTNDNSDTDYTPATEALHLKGPLVNEKNESTYYESRGRMQQVDWETAINDKKDTHNGKKNYKPSSQISQSQNKSKLHNTITKCSQTKPDVNDDFVNFVKNSTTDNVVYEVSGNLRHLPNSIDSPVLKIQRLMNNNGAQTVHVTQDIKESFKCSQSNSRVIDKIDSPINILASTQNEQAKTSNIKCEKYNNTLNKNQEISNLSKKFTNLCDFESRDTLSTLSKPDQEKKKIVEDIDDSMFVFEKYKPASLSTKFVDLREPKENKSSDNDSCKSTTSASLSYFNKLKKCCSEKSNTSLDSDDLSSKSNCEESDSQFEKSSTISKSRKRIESFRKMLKDASTQYSPNCTESLYNNNTSTDSQDSVINIERSKENRKFLKIKTSSKYIKVCNSDKDLDVNTTEIISSNIVPEEPLLKAVSTRYFKQPENLEERSNNSNKTGGISRKLEIIKSYAKAEQLKATKVNKVVGDTQITSVKSDMNIQNHDTKTIFVSSNNVQSEKNKNSLSEESAFSENESVASQSSALFSDKDFQIKRDNKDEPQDLVIEKVNTTSKDNKDLVPFNFNKSDPSTFSSTTSTENENDDLESIYSDEGFDFVNIEKLAPFMDLVNSLKRVQDAQKAMSMGFEIKDEESNNDNKSSNTSKSSESSLEVSDGNCSSVNASISSNLDTDSDAGTVNKHLSIFNEDDNIFRDTTIDSNVLNNGTIDYLNTVTKSSDPMTIHNRQTILSKRKEKMKNILNNYKQNLMSKDDQAGSEDKLQQSDLVFQNEN